MESFRAEVLLGRMVRLRNRAENLMCEGFRAVLF